MANRLIDETSPYLLQHAHNPVDWYPWGPDALRRAKEEDKPILLSIGYSACHWCHVMEGECFEDPEIAQIMNEHFINVKVDREERPDLDTIYMQAVQAMTGRGGWPLTVFVTADGEPLYGGTYFPPEDRHGLPSFPRVLLAVAEAYRTRRDDVVRAGQQLASRLRQAAQTRPSVEPLSSDLLHDAYRTLAAPFDTRDGGFGAPPKFPQAMAHEFLLRYYHRTGDQRALAMVELTLDRMARGGMYDQLGGGFHRYSTDGEWLVPHFEKMLYDNALLSRLYLRAYQATRRPFYRRIAEETLDYVLREMTAPNGGFYSAQDADSEGVEGTFYVWTRKEILTAIGPEDGDLFCQYFGVTEEGNFEARNILHVPQEAQALAQEIGVNVQRLTSAVARGKARLLAVRHQRPRPSRDEKILAGWNGLMIRSLAEAACILRRQDYRQAAEDAAAFLLDALCPQGRLLHTHKDGQAKLLAYLDDHAFLADGLLALHEATFHPRWLQEAQRLAQASIDLFWEEGDCAFYDTGRDHESLVVRPRDIVDNATPCGGSAAAEVLARLAIITGEERYASLAARTLRSMRDPMAQSPNGLTHWLCALDFYLSTPNEIAIAGPRNHPATEALLAVIYDRFLPNKVLVGCEPGDNSGPRLPLLEGRSMVNGHPTAYVCERYSCQRPVNTPEALARELEPTESLEYRGA
ncbi:MAG: thioredoxin domain-containing protein [Dehalococcoidia bacterium]|nr:thioredoxin domain-containing protein [Dehalococcoidia bacterium]